MEYIIISTIESRVQNSTAGGNKPWIKMFQLPCFGKTVWSCDCAPSMLWWVWHHTSSKHTGALSEQKTNWLPQAGPVSVTLGKPGPQLLRRTVSEMGICWRQLCAQQREFLLASAALAQSGKPRALSESAYSSGAQPGKTLSPWEQVEISRDFFGWHRQLGEETPLASSG